MKNRSKESIKAIINQNSDLESPIILTSSSDIGVRRNFGRNGTRFAPTSILASFQKLQNQLRWKNIDVKEVSSQKLEQENFEVAQIEEANAITDLIKSHSRIIHIGGGHDHAYPFLRAVKKHYSKILILNFDAHCDTRIDDRHHSGTPFRNFDEITDQNTRLIQVGVHLYANSISTMSPLKNIYQMFITKEDKNDQALFSELSQHLTEINKDTFIFVSLDADGLAASEMEAVSAPNHNGFTQTLIRQTNKYLTKNYPDNSIAFGVYEYNPIFENLSQKGARLISSLMYDFLEG